MDNLERVAILIDRLILARQKSDNSDHSKLFDESAVYLSTLQTQNEELRAAHLNDLKTIAGICEEDDTAPISRIWRYAAQRLATLTPQVDTHD